MTARWIEGPSFETFADEGSLDTDCVAHTTDGLELWVDPVREGLDSRLPYLRLHTVDGQGDSSSTYTWPALDALMGREVWRTIVDCAESEDPVLSPILTRLRDEAGAASPEELAEEVIYGYGHGLDELEDEGRTDEVEKAIIEVATRGGCELNDSNQVGGLIRDEVVARVVDQFRNEGMAS